MWGKIWSCAWHDTKCVVCDRSAYITHAIQVFLIGGLGTRLYMQRTMMNGTIYIMLKLFTNTQNKSKMKKGLHVCLLVAVALWLCFLLRYKMFSTAFSTRLVLSASAFIITT